MNATLLAEAERILRQHSPADFDTTVDAGPECVEYVRAVEDEAAWRAGYASLEDFYAAHEARHPDIRLYAEVRREIETGALTPGGTLSQRLDRLRKR